MQYTEEQLEAINSSDNRVIRAVAGSGKTTVCKGIADKHPDRKILYLCFNRSNKEEVSGKFPKNTRIETMHSLAYKDLGVFAKFTLRNNNYPPVEVITILGIKKPEPKEGEEKDNTRYFDLKVASYVLKKFEYYCNSAIASLDEFCIRELVVNPRALAFVDKYKDLINDYTKQLWDKMFEGSIEITHSFYLKLFQLSNPYLNYDIIIFDEAQDSSPQMLDIILKQEHATLVFVGDSNQQIYSWRGAIDSLDKVDFKVFPLSVSFRFREDIAHLANEIIRMKDYIGSDYHDSLKGVGGTTEQRTRAVIARNNISILEKALYYITAHGHKKFFFEGGYNSYIFESSTSIYDVLNLLLGNTDRIQNQLIKQFDSFGDLGEYIEETEDNEMKVLYSIVTKYKSSLFGLLKSIKSRVVANKEEADIIFTTTHKAKGQEYDIVELASDFITEAQIIKVMEESPDAWRINGINESINILYVAATRARNKLVFPVNVFGRIPCLNESKSNSLYDSPLF